MPIYEYRCTSCGHELEALQKLSDAPLSECPACHRAALQKKVSAAGFQLKGSGWYVTDFRNKQTTQPAKGDAKAADKASDAASDAKAPAAATSESATTTQSGSASEAKSTTTSSADKSAG